MISPLDYGNKLNDEKDITKVSTNHTDLENSDVRKFMSNRALPNHKPTILVVCLILNVKAAYMANDKNLNVIE